MTPPRNLKSTTRLRDSVYGIVDFKAADTPSTPKFGCLFCQLQHDQTPSDENFEKIDK